MKIAIYFDKLIKLSNLVISNGKLVKFSGNIHDLTEDKIKDMVFNYENVILHIKDKIHIYCKYNYSVAFKDELKSINNNDIKNQLLENVILHCDTYNCVFDKNKNKFSIIIKNENLKI